MGLIQSMKLRYGKTWFVTRNGYENCGVIFDIDEAVIAREKIEPIENQLRSG